jgi:hypothetical protein
MMQPAPLPDPASRRSLLLFAAGAVLGLGIAGYGLFSARGTTIRYVPPEDVALVNQRPILRSDFIAQTEAETGTAFAQTSAAERRHVMDEMIREEIFVQRGLELDFPGTDPDTRTALVAAVEQQAAADATTWQPDDAELQQYFAAHREDYATNGVMVFHDLLLQEARASDSDARATLLAAAAALRAGASLPAVVQSYRLSEKTQPGTRPEQFYFAARALLGEALFAQAVALAPGDVTAPVEAEDGLHIVQLVENHRLVPREFAQVRAQVLADARRALATRLQAANERYLRDQAEILIAGTP